MLDALQLDALPVDKTNRHGAAPVAQQVAQKVLDGLEQRNLGGDSFAVRPSAFSSIFSAWFPFLRLLCDVMYSRRVAAPIWDVPRRQGPCAAAVPRAAASLILVALRATSSRCFAAGVGEEGCAAGSCFALSIDN